MFGRFLIDFFGGFMDLFGSSLFGFGLESGIGASGSIAPVSGSIAPVSSGIAPVS